MIEFHMRRSVIEEMKELRNKLRDLGGGLEIKFNKDPAINL
eukprot:CAMPEP_0201525488 /NCGR_PEP_ID=MMETSP0161_2-20130828/28399_1 /ASSEMBLY_ACC=CAM_ASM_000251 /TAXON_ID=180227 /ORGANISM="Neoparamoeba aestuarina, Strain SoJaBio B1-5/56/2" /LENGTH=40 /DNA_ID= /DNA_START= /DNA_END= /DNA_ORIENTATION=